jgi:serine/threonine protein kinase
VNRGAILHKDIASSNVVLDKNLNARLIDFGLAREKNDTSKTYSEKPGYTHPQKGNDNIKESLDYYNFGISKLHSNQNKIFVSLFVIIS